MRWWMLVLIGCGEPEAVVRAPQTDVAEPLEVDATGRASLPRAADPSGVWTRFAGTTSFAPSAEQAFAARRLCPRLEWARYRHATDQFYELLVQGEGLDRVTAVAVQKADGTFGTPRHRLVEVEEGAEPPPAGELGALLMPIGCTDCTVYLGVELPDGHTAACRGPGFIVQLVDGKLVAGRSD